MDAKYLTYLVGHINYTQRAQESRPAHRTDQRQASQSESDLLALGPMALAHKPLSDWAVKTIRSLIFTGDTLF